MWGKLVFSVRSRGSNSMRISMSRPSSTPPPRRWTTQQIQGKKWIFSCEYIVWFSDYSGHLGGTPLVRRISRRPGPFATTTHTSSSSASASLSLTLLLMWKPPGWRRWSWTRSKMLRWVQQTLLYVWWPIVPETACWVEGRLEEWCHNHREVGEDKWGEMRWMGKEIKCNFSSGSCDGCSS